MAGEEIKAVVVRSTRVSRVAAMVAVPLLLALALAPAWGSRGLMGVLVEFFYYLALAQMWNLLAGFGGVISLGQHAYLGLGGYLLFLLTMVGHLPPLVALVVAGVLCAVVSLPVAGLIFRLHGAYLAIGSWVVAEVFRLLAYKFKALGGGTGISLPVEMAERIDVPGIGRDGLLYLVAFAICVAVNAGAYGLLRSRGGLAVEAIRDNERAAGSCGIDSRRIKLVLYAATALGTGLCGALIYLSNFYISPTAAFDINWTSYMIFIVVIGGVGTLEGPVVGTVVFFVLREYLSSLGSWYLILLGALAIAVMLRLPDGIWGSFRKRYGVSLLPLRRRLVVDLGALSQGASSLRDSD